VTETDNDDEKNDTARQFDHKEYDGVVFVQEDVLCSMQHKAGIPASWMLLDSQSTVDIFCNAKNVDEYS